MTELCDSRAFVGIVMAEVELGSSKVGEQVQSKLQVRGLKFMYRVFLKKNFFLNQSTRPFGNSDT